MARGKKREKRINEKLVVKMTRTEDNSKKKNVLLKKREKIQELAQPIKQEYPQKDRNVQKNKIK